MENKEQDTQYCFSKEGAERNTSGNWHIDGRQFSQQSAFDELVSTYSPKEVKSKKEKKIEELRSLYERHYELDKKFEKAKGRRAIWTTLFFILFYFALITVIVDNLLTLSLSALDDILIVAIVFGLIHFWMNATIFSQLSMKGREEREILDKIKKRISELEKDLQ